MWVGSPISLNCLGWFRSNFLGISMGWAGLDENFQKKFIEYCTSIRRDLDVLSVLVTKFTGIRTVVQCWG